MLKAYKYCLLPTDEQKETFSRWFGMVRFIYNLGLEVKIRAWASAQKNVTCFDLMKQTTELKKTECTWLADCPSQSLESALTNLDNAYTKFFKGGGFPRFKKRSDNQSMQFRQECRVDGDKIRLSKIGWLDFIKHRPLGRGEIRTCTVSKTTTGKYFISILVKDEKELPTKKKVRVKTAVGIDVGLNTFAALSDGSKFENPKFLHHQLKRLKTAQRTLSRRFKKRVKIVDQSKGYHKQRLIVAKLHEKIKNQRQDFLHKVSDSITKNFDTICLEDLNVKGMMQNGKLSKAISDVGWNRFNEFLKYKAEWRGKNIIYIGRFDPSSKICSTCGTINKELKLADREWDCKKCGQHHDRDENAAKNIKNFGLKAKPSIAKVGH